MKYFLLYDSMQKGDVNFIDHLELTPPLLNFNPYEVFGLN